MSHYRDGFAGAREQVAERRAIVEELLRKITPLHRAMFDMSRIDEAFARACDPKLPIQDVFAIFDRLTNAIPEAMAEAERLVALRGDAPASMLGIATLGPDVFPTMEEAARPYRAAVEREDGGARTMIVVDGVSISIAARAPSIGEKIDSDGGTVWLLAAAAIAVPPALAHLQVSLGAFGDSILAKLGLIEDHVIGDVPFDDTFRIRGELDAARALLQEDVRKALLNLHLCAPILEVKAGRAQLSWAEHWRDDAEQMIRRDAVAALLGIHRALALSSKP